jgi:ribosomal protein L4
MTNEWNKNVKLVRILNDDYELKLAAIEGEVEEQDGSTKSAVLIFEKTSFELNDVKILMQENTEQFQMDFINDIYHKYLVQARSSCNGMFPIDSD